MRPLKLTIRGEFYDSHIYSGRLFLFQCDNSIRTVEWDQLLSTLRVPSALRVGVVAGFLRSDFLYGQDLAALFQDPDIRALVTAKFDALSVQSLEIAAESLERCTRSRQDNKFPFPHSDCEIYLNRLYVGGKSGVWSAGCRRNTKHGVSTRVERMFDAPTLGLAVSYMTVAAAAGSDGLFEFPVDSGLITHAQRPTSEQACEDCHWTYQSIYASSREGGYLADYAKPQWQQRNIKEWDESDEPRELLGIVSGRDLFKKSGFGWGTGDKICLASNGSIHVARYAPTNQGLEHRTTLAGTFEAVAPSEDIVGGALAPFGAVVEYATGLVVYASDGTTLNLDGEPVNWRVFPRSKHYENHLHITYEDRIEIFSFNHDYLIDQKTKIAGIAARLPHSRSGDRLVELMAALGDVTH